jgi:hypothetical protein
VFVWLCPSRTGVRCMMGWCGLPAARGYAFGLYVDDAAVGLAREEASKLNRLLEVKSSNASSCEVALLLKIARPIDGPHIAKGFEKSLTKRIHGLDVNSLVGDELAQLKGFVALFSPKNFIKGGTVISRCSCAL